MMLPRILLLCSLTLIAGGEQQSHTNTRRMSENLRPSQPHPMWYAPENSNSLGPDDACSGKVVQCGAAGIKLCHYNKGKEEFKTICVNPNGAASHLSKHENDYCGQCVDTPRIEQKTYYNSPYDGRLFSFSIGGTDITYYGPYGKDLDIPLSMEVVSPDGNRTTFTMNSLGNITKMEVVDFNDEYSRFEFDYLPTGLLVKLYLPAYSYQASLLFPPFNIDDPSGTGARLLQESKEDQISQDLPEEELVGAHVTTEMEAGFRLLQSSSNPAEAWIFLTECLKNVDPNELRVTASSDGNSFPVIAERDSKGFYKAKLSVADSEISDDVIGYACDGIELVGSYACPFIVALGPGSPFLCGAASTALASTGAGAAVAPVAYSACLAGFSGGATVCAVYVGAGGGLPPGAPNLIDEACDATADLAEFIEDLFFPETVTVTAEARLPSGDFVRGSSTWEPEADGSIGPPIDLEGPGIPVVTEFSPVPDAPVGGQPYTAFAFIICASNQTTATIDIQGTDGYTNQVVCSGPQIQSTGGCSLPVPGAEAGVVDTLTLRVNDPTTPEIFRVTGLFFR